MKEYWKMLRRGLAMMLAVVMLLTSSNIGVVLHAAATGTDEPAGESVTLTDIVLELYKDNLSENLIKIIESGAVNVTQTFAYIAPTGEDGLITVEEDEEVQKITAEVYSDGKYNWYPVAYRLVNNDGEVVENGVITEWPNGVAEVAYKYAGNAFTVKVDYEATVTLDEAQQNKLLSSGEKLAEDIATLLLLKENIIPEKPENWDDFDNDEDRIKEFGEEKVEEVKNNEKLQAYIDEALKSIPGMAGLELNPQIVLMFMTQKVLAFNGEENQSAIDLLGLLGEGIVTVIGTQDSIPEELQDVMLDEYDDVFKVARKDTDNYKKGDIYVELKIEDQYPNTDNQEALASLTSQGDGLLLSKYLSVKGSYLEWLMVTYDAMKEAVKGNYEDLNQLATSGLPGMVSDMLKLQAAVVDVRKAAWDLIAKTAGEYGLEITEKNGKLEYYTDEAAGFDRLLADYANVKDEETGKSLNDQLAELGETLQNDVPEGYESYVPKLPVTQITCEDDLDDLIDYIADMDGKLETALNHIYGEIDAALADYEVGTVRDDDDAADAITKLEKDIATAEKNIATIQKNVASLVGKTAEEVTYADIAAKIAELKSSMDTSALKPYDDAVATAWSNAQTMAQDWGYPNYAQIIRGADLSVFTALETWLDAQPAAAQAAYDKVLADVDSAIAEMLPDGVELPIEYKEIDSAAEFGDFRQWITEYLEDAKVEYANGLAEINAKVSEADEKIRNDYSDFGVSTYRGGYLEPTDSLDDIKGKINDIRSWMNHLKKTISNKKTEALTKADEYGVDLTGSNAVAEAMEKARAEADEAAAEAIADLYPAAYDAANEELAKINTDLSMATFGETTRWTKAEDVDNAIYNAKNGTAEASVWTAFNKELPEKYQVNSVEGAQAHITTLNGLLAAGVVTQSQYDEIAGPLNSAIQGVNAITTDYIPALEEAKTTLADAVGEINQAKEDELAELEADLKEYKNLLDQADEALAMIEDYAGMVSEDSKDLQALYDAKALIDEADNALTTNAEDLDKLETKLAEEEAKRDNWQNVSGKKTEVAAKKQAIVDAQTAYKTEMDKLDDVNSANITYLENQQGAWGTELAKIKISNNGITAVNAQKDNLDNAATILKMKDQVAGYDLAGAKTAAEAAYASLLELPAYLDLLDSTDAELETNIELLNILITMLNLLCEKIQPIYTNCENNNWNAQKILNTTGVDYEALTALVYTDDEFQNVSHNVKNVEGEHTLPTATVEYKMSMFDINVVAKAQVVDENNKLVDLDDFLAGKKTLVAGAGSDEIMAAVDEIMTLEKEAELEAFWGDFDFGGYDREVTKVTGPLTADLEFVLSYSPKSMKMTYGAGIKEGELEESYPYGWNLLLPKHTVEGKEWEYTVNGEKFRQDTVVKITKDTTISRTEGDASAIEFVVDIVIDTNGDLLNDTAQTILNSDAVYLDDFIYIRKPSNKHLVKSTNGDTTTIKAEPYDSNGYGNWVAVSATVDGKSVDVVNNSITIEGAFEKVVVNYELQLTADSLKVDLDQYINAPYYLANDYAAQMAALEALVEAVTVDTDGDGEAKPLEALGMLDRSTEMMGFSLGSVFSMLGTEMENTVIKPTIVSALGVDEATADQLLIALKAMNDEEILPYSGKTPLYDTLNSYNNGGMAHYYKNSTDYIKQIGKLNEVMQQMPVDTLSKLGGVGNAFVALYNALSVADTDLNAYPVSDLINVKSDSLTSLLDKLADYEQNAPFAVPSALTWSVPLSVAGDGVELHKVTVVVQGVGTKVSEEFSVKPNQGFDDATVADDIYQAMVNEGIREYYKNAVVTSEVDDDGVTNHIYTYNYKTYTLEIEGCDSVTLTYVNREITLPRHETAGYAWKYNVFGEEVEVKYSDAFDRKYTLALEHLDAIEAGATITRTAINIAESSLTSLIEGMGGALYKNEAGEYTVVLGIDPNNTDSLMGLVMGLYMSGYESVSMGDAVLVSNGQFHLQTLVDVLLNSGISTNELNKNIASNGTITNTLDLPEGLTVVGTNTANGNHLTLVESSLTFGDLAPMNLYMTLTGDGSAFKSILSTVAGYGVDVVLENGSANLSVTIPEAFYTAYLAALSMVGEVDVDNVNDVNAEIALGYITSMITDIMNEEGVSIETFGNTIGKDLSAYGSYYDMAKSLMNLIVYNDDCTITLDLPVLPINGIIDSLAGSIQLPIEDISLGDMIAEYDTGLKVGVGAKFNNFANEYDVLFVDVKADGLTNKFGMKTLDEVGKLDFATTSVVVLLDNIENLYIHDTLTLVDLNGFNVTGKITGGANADVIVIDSNYEADRGVVGGVEGNVTVLAGKYLSDVSAFVNDGYKQDDNGVVCNKLFTVSETNDVITVTLNTTVADAKTLLTEEGVFGLAAEILFDQFINHYNVAAVSMDDNTIYNINFEDVLAIVSGGAGAIVDTALDFVYEDQLSAVFNTLVADLTDFAAIGAALSDNGTGVIASHKFATTTWGLELAHDSDDDTVSVNFGGSYGKTETKTLQLEIEGEARGAMAVLSTALGKVLDVDFTVDLDDIYRNDAGLLNIKGDVTGTVVFDFTENPAYAIMMSVILAENADEALRADLIEAIEVFYETGSLNLMRQVYNEMTIEDICNSWDEHIGVDSFVEIVDSLNLSCAEKIKSQIGDDEMGFDLLIDGIAAALRLLNEYGVGESVTDSGRTMGSLELEDENGYYYGRVGSFNVAGTNSLMDYELNATSVGAKIYLFTDDELPIAGPSIEIDVEKITVDGKLYGVKYDEEKGYLILDTVAEGMTEAEVLAILTQGSVVENDINDMAEKIASNVVGSNGLVGTGSTFTLQAKNSVGETADVTVTIIILGDVSCDGVLNSGDSVLMHNYVLNRNNVVLTEIQKIAGNTNGLASSFSRDGIDSGDAVIVMNKWLNRYVESKLGEYESPLKN